VRVHSNGGQVSITASVVQPLASAAGTLGFSQLTVTSNNGNILPPLSPNPGTSPGSGQPRSISPPLNGVSDFSAIWTFTFTPPANALPGVYNGRLSYTATAL